MNATPTTSPTTAPALTAAADQLAALDSALNAWAADIVRHGGDVADGFTCQHADAVALVLLVAGHRAAAEKFLFVHSAADDTDTDWHCVNLAGAADPNATVREWAARYVDDLTTLALHQDIRTAAGIVPEREPGTGRTSWTVSISGPERHDGEKCTTYCVYAHSEIDAVVHVRAFHVREREGSVDPDLYRRDIGGESAYVITEKFHGVPADGVWYRWNDLRPAQSRKAA